MNLGRLGRLAPRTEQSLAAALIYGVTSLLMFGIPTVWHLSRWYVGWGTDPASHVWFMAWWPHALAAGTNPFLTRAVWAPSGYNLAGSTGLPGPSLVFAPVTALFGPVVSYNLFSLAAPAASAWTAFLLCRRLTGRFGPSLVGGYLFGFSTYELGQLSGHPNLAMTALVPVAVHLVVRRLAGDLRPRRFVVLMALVVVGQFLTSTEVVLTMTLFGGLAFAVALALWRGEVRRSIARTAAQVGVAYAVAAVPLAPYLYYVAKGASQSPIYAFYPSLYATDALNFVLPTPLTLLGRHRFALVSARFSGNLSEQVGYLGIPVIIAVAAFAVSRWRRTLTKFLVVMLALVGLATLGPTLRVDGVDTVPLPWQAFIHIPFVKYVLPSRLMLYAFLVAGVVVAMWLAGAGEDPPGPPAWGRPARWGIAALAVIMLVPNPGLPLWRTRVDTPAFFADGLYRAHLERGDTILIIPYGDRGNSMLWQAQAGFDFDMAEGYVSVVPPRQFAGYPILKTFYDGNLIPDAAVRLREFLRDKGVRAVVVQAGRPGPWTQLFGAIDPHPLTVGGVILYRVPTSVLAGADGSGG